MSIDVEELHDEHSDEVLAVINAAFGFDRAADWYQWKHREGPWGPSRGVIARDGQGIVGVRLLLGGSSGHRATWMHSEPWRPQRRRVPAGKGSSASSTGS